MSFSSSQIASISRTMEDVQYTKIWLDFWSKIISSLIWPLIILLVLLLVYFNRKKISTKIPEISKLIHRTKSVKLGSASISFSESLAKMDEEKSNVLFEKSANYEVLDTSDKEIDNVSLKWFTPDREFRQLAFSRPDFAIIDSLRPIERLIQSTFVSSRGRPLPIPVALKRLLVDQKITEDQFYFIHELVLLKKKRSS